MRAASVTARGERWNSMVLLMTGKKAVATKCASIDTSVLLRAKTSSRFGSFTPSLRKAVGTDFFSSLIHNRSDLCGTQIGAIEHGDRVQQHALGARRKRVDRPGVDDQVYRDAKQHQKAKGDRVDRPGLPVLGHHGFTMPLMQVVSGRGRAGCACRRCRA